MRSSRFHRPPDRTQTRPRPHARPGQISLRPAIVLFLALLAGVSIWTYRSTRQVADDGREPIVFWGGVSGEDIYALIDQFERECVGPDGKPRYKVVFGNAVSRNLTGDAQRLLCAVSGGVPPDLVNHDRFAIGEWAARGALEDLTPYLRRQDPEHNEWDRRYLLAWREREGAVRLSEYYDWATDEASYRPPGGSAPPRLYGVPTGADIRALYCNGDLLLQAGLEENGQPRPPKSWEELRRYANQLTLYHDGLKSKGIKRLGFAPNYGNSWLYLYAWQAGGEFMSPDRTRVTLTSPPVVRALRYMTDIYDDLGSFAQVEVFQSSLLGGENDPFLRGQVAMKIDGDWALRGIADWKRDMNFVLTAAPLPQSEIDKGRTPVTWAGGWSLVVPSTAHNKEGAWRLIQFLRSWRTMKRLEQGVQEQRQSEGRLFLPSGNANRKFYEEMVREHVDANEHMPPTFKRAYGVFKDLMPGTLIRPVTPVGQLLWERHRSAYENAVRHRFAEEARRAGGDEVEMALADAQADVQRMLDDTLTPAPKETEVHWAPFIAGYGALVAAPLGAIWLAYRRRRRSQGYKPREVGAALLFASPWMIGFAVFVGGPILFSIVFSFTRYDVLNRAHWVGLGNYRQIVSDKLFFKSLANTLFMTLRIPLGMTVSLGIALLLNRAIRGIGAYRTAFYMPAIVPLVASSLLWVWLLNPSQGALNRVLAPILASAPAHWLEWVINHLHHFREPFRFSPPLWLQSETWSKPSLILTNLWTAGGGMIIWLAGLQSIPAQLYEAASIDGAGPWRRFRHVTLPMLSPYILFNLVVGLIGTMQVFGEAFIMTEGGPADSTLFYAYYLFRQAFQFFRLGYASALAWILFVIVLALTLVQLWLSKRWVHYEQA